MKVKSKILAVLLTTTLVGGMLTGCAGSTSTKSAEEKVFNYGTTAYGVAMGNAGLNPHEGYSGWSTVRYGVGETLFKFNEKMELEPWLAKDYEQIDDYTVKINLRDDVTFSNGKNVTGEAVKACFDNLIAVHDRPQKTYRLSQSPLTDKASLLFQRIRCRVWLTISVTHMVPSSIWKLV